MTTPPPLPSLSSILAPKPDAAAPASPAPLPRRGLRGRLIRLVLVLGCFAIGLGTSIAFQSGAKEPAAPEDSPWKPSDSTETASTPAEHPSTETPSITSHIDLLIRTGSFDEALTECQTALETDAGKDIPALAYREALCLEALDRLEEATAAYRRAEEPNGDIGAWALATLGRARCAAADGDLHLAADLVDRVFLRSGHPDCLGGHIPEECSYLQAHLAVLALGSHRLDPFDPEALAWASLDASLDKYLDWLPPGEIPRSPHHPAAERGAASVTYDVDGQPVITAHLTGKPCIMLESMGTAAGLKTQVSAAFAAVLAGEDASVDVVLAPLPDVLTALTRQFQAGWKIEGNVLIVEKAQAAKSNKAAEVAANALRRVLDVAPEHPNRLAVRIAMANLDYQAGRSREAIAAFRQFLDRETHTPESIHAAYNLGLIELRQGNLANARGRFMDVIDREPISRWADFGWWWVGRTLLDSGDTEEARQAFATSRGGKTKITTSAATLGICICEILDGDDTAARTILREQRVGNGETETALWELFEGFLRYRINPTESRRDILIQALHDGDDGRVLGTAAIFLAGTAYREIGLHEEMAALYEKATETARGPLAARMTFAVAEWLDQLDLRAKARQKYLAVAAIDPSGLGPQAELKVADLAARDGRGEECVLRCRALVDRPGIDRDALLATLGRGYELQRNYRLAAECFAGHFPAE